MYRLLSKLQKGSIEAPGYLKRQETARELRLVALPLHLMKTIIVAPIYNQLRWHNLREIPELFVGLRLVARCGVALRIC